MAYTPPSRTAVTVDFTDAYTAPSRSAVNANFVDETVKLRVSAKGPLEISNSIQVTTAGNALQASALGPLEVSNSILVEVEVQSVELRASALGPLDLMSAEAVTRHDIGLRASAPGPLEVSDPIQVTMAGNALQASALGPLEVGNSIQVTTAGNALQASALGPLETSNSIQVVVEVPVQMFVSAPDPLTAQSSAFTMAGNALQASAPGPLETSNSIQVVGYVEQVAQISVPGPLETSNAIAMYSWHDFSSVVGAEAVSFYVVDLEILAGTVRLPISSWQATLQTGSQSYIQCVIPAALSYVSALEDALGEVADFVISKGVRLPDGSTIVQEMARGPAETLRLDQGPGKYTATLSGYAEAFVASTIETTATDRYLTGIRQVSSGSGGDIRTRADIDWFLRPGFKAYIDEVTYFTADYVNYYVNSSDAYMDAGQRSV